MRALATFVTILGSVAVFGQRRDTAAIFGGVSDSQGAAIRGASVALTSTATGQARNGQPERLVFLLGLPPAGHGESLPAKPSKTLPAMPATRAALLRPALPARSPTAAQMPPNLQDGQG